MSWDTPRGSGPLLSRAVRSTESVRTCNSTRRRWPPVPSFCCVPLHAVPTAVSGMRIIAPPGKGEALREQSHLCFIPVSAGGAPTMTTPLWHACPFVRDGDEMGHSFFDVLCCLPRCAHNVASKSGWIAVLYRAEPLRAQTSLRSGHPSQRHPATPFEPPRL